MLWKIGTRFYRRTDVKITLWYIFTFSISVLIVSGIMYLRLKHQLIKEIDRFILDETKEVAEVLLRTANGGGSLGKFESETKGRKYYPFFFRILGESGRIFYNSKEFEKSDGVFNERLFSMAVSGKQTRENIWSPDRKKKLRMISTPIERNGRLLYMIQLGTQLGSVERSLSNFKENILSILPILLVLGSLGGWVLARRSLSPIGYITSRTKTITSKNLSERLIPRGTGDEMDDLVRTINDMIVRLESSFKRMAEFTADASHELKTPLCAMRGEAEVLLSKIRPAEEYQEGLAHFIEEFDHLNQMINDLILLSKFDAAQVELKMGPLRLDLIIRGICNLFEVLAEQNGISLDVDAAEAVVVMGDKVRLQQLFTNLIHNAIKYTPRGSIRITVAKNGNWVQTEVIDTGIGIPLEEQANIFKRFYRIDKSRSRESGGTGLGLSIVEWIVEAHLGKIEVRSHPQEGSTFIVTLPLFHPSNQDFLP